VRTWFGKPLWDMQPADADSYFGKSLRTAAKGTRLARAQALTTFFAFLELRHQAEIHAMTGRIVECPIDEMNKPRGRKQGALRIPPTKAEVATLFAGWRQELVTCRKFAPTARNYVAAKLMAEVGLRVNEPGVSTWRTSSGSWAGSASCTSASARVREAAALGSGWCR